MTRSQVAAMLVEERAASITGDRRHPSSNSLETVMLGSDVTTDRWPMLWRCVYAAVVDRRSRPRLRIGWEIAMLLLAQ